jgi:hypothetical protein
MSSYRFLAALTAGVVLAWAPSLLAQDEKKDRGSHQSPRREASGGHQGGESRPAPQARPAQPAGGERQSPRQGGRQYGGQNQGSPNRPAETPHVAQPAQAPRQDTGSQGRQFGTPRQSSPAGQPAGQNQDLRRQQQGGTSPGYTGSRPAPSGGTSPSYSGRPAQPRDTFNNRPSQPAGMNPSYSGGRPPAGGVHGTEVIRTRNGGQVYRSPGGAIREVRTPNGAVIHHAPGGIRQVEVVRPGGRVVVANSRGNYGYVQRPLVVHNVTYVQRTYVYHGAPYVRVYRPWIWGGVTFHVYTPMRYYRPAFYAWTWTPWPRPVYYSWGWGGSPWYGYWGGWFAPYPYYTSPAFWLTDYLIARTLEDAYDQRMADRAAAAAAQADYGYGQTQLTPEVKQAIADEVHRQMEAERAQQGQASDGGIFGDNSSHVFVVSSPLQVNDGGMGCALTEGDVLQMTTSPAPGAPAADVVVLASKGQDCRKGSRVQVGLNDLQEMHNQMLATLDQGLNDLQSKQGQNGIPSLPPDARGTTNATFAADVRPDPDAAGELNQAAQEADRDERDVVSQADTQPSTINISLGMSISDVERNMGKPRQIADLGAKKVYVYPEMKIIFMDGKVTDVQ